MDINTRANITAYSTAVAADSSPSNRTATRMT
jgi:hypothetical protein